MEFLKTHLHTVRTSLATLSRGLDSTRQEIGALCAEIKTQVDEQAETLIRRVNEDRARLLEEIRLYEQQALIAFNSSAGKRELENLVHEATEFSTRSEEEVASDEVRAANELEIANAYLEKIKLSIANLKETQFNNNLIAFESVSFPSERLFLGEIFYKPIANEKIIQEVCDMGSKFNYKESLLVRPASYVPFVDYTDPINVHLKALNSGRFLLFENFKNGDKRLSILSNDFRFIEQTRFFLQCFAHEAIEHKLQDQRLTLSGDKICFYVRMDSRADVEYHVYIFDESLSLLRAKNFKVRETVNSFD
jgi:hypothetical protein